MKEENKVSIQEVHEMLNQRAGRQVSGKHLNILLGCWRKARHYRRKGREGWLSRKDANDFLKYAY